MTEDPAWATFAALQDSRVLLYVQQLGEKKAEPVKNKAFLEISPFFSDSNTQFAAIHLYIPEENLDESSKLEHMALIVYDDEGNIVVQADERADLK